MGFSYSAYHLLTVSRQFVSVRRHNPYQSTVCVVRFDPSGTLEIRFATTEDDEDRVKWVEGTQELKVAAACLCADLMPPSYFADLLEDHRSDLSEVTAFLREWERLKGEQK